MVLFLSLISLSIIRDCQVAYKSQNMTSLNNLRQHNKMEDKKQTGRS